MAELSLKWEKFGLSSGLHSMLEAGQLVDVTLLCQGEYLEAHKTVLAACSSHFKHIFTTNPCQHPVVFMQDVPLNHLRALLNFMYTGEATVHQRELGGFMHTAEALQISGLTSAPEPSTSQTAGIPHSTQLEDWLPDVGSPMSLVSNVASKSKDTSSFSNPQFLSALSCTPSVSNQTPRTSNVQNKNRSVPSSLSSPIPGLNIPTSTSIKRRRVERSSLSSDFAVESTSMSTNSNSETEINNAQASEVEARRKSVKEETRDIWILPSPTTEQSSSMSVRQPSANSAALEHVLASVSDQQNSTKRRCCALLDGKYYRITKDVTEGLWAQCQLCLPNIKLIKGSWETTSNFKTHLARVHKHHLTEYEEYKRTWVKPYLAERLALFRRMESAVPVTLPVGSPESYSTSRSEENRMT